MQEVQDKTVQYEVVPSVTTATEYGSVAVANQSEYEIGDIKPMNGQSEYVQGDLHI